MTFYNIIFGILFFGATREAFRSAFHPQYAGLSLALTLMFLIFSDTVYTSHVIENKGKDYTMPMKLLDLFSFLLLSCALFALNPTQTNFFEVAATERIVGCRWEPAFWFFLCLYWIVLILWNAFGGIRFSSGLLNMIQPIYLALFAFMWILSIWWPDGGVAYVFRIVLAVATFAYLIGYKRIAADKIVS